MNQSAGALAVEQAGGRVYPLKSLGYENQQTRCSVVRLVSTERCAAVRCGTVRLCSLLLVFHRAVRFGAAWFAYIGVSTIGPEMGKVPK